MKRERVNSKPVIRIEGDVFTVEFIQNKEPKRKPICRVNGKIGFINKTYRSQYVAPGSVWLVELNTITEKFVIVDPIECIETTEEHQDLMERKLKTLKTFATTLQKDRTHKNKS
jgi:hypothetical protein